MRRIIAVLLALVLYCSFTSNVIAFDDYPLPYPGILPTSRVYVFKVARDNFLLWFTSDNLQKAQLTLFLSDKRLATAQALWQKKEYALARASLQKSNDYLIQSLELQKKNIGDKKAAHDLTMRTVLSLQTRNVLINQLPANLSSVLKDEIAQNNKLYASSINVLSAQVIAPNKY